MGVKSISELDSVESMQDDDLLVIQTRENTNSINYKTFSTIMKSLISGIEVKEVESGSITSLISINDPGLYHFKSDHKISVGNKYGSVPNEYKNKSFYLIIIRTEWEDSGKKYSDTLGIIFNILSGVYIGSSYSEGSSSDRSDWVMIGERDFKNQVMLDEYDEPLMSGDNYLYYSIVGNTTFSTQQTEATSIKSISELNKLTGPGLWRVDLSSLNDSVLNNLGEGILVVYRQDYDSGSVRIHRTLHANDSTGKGTPKVFINSGILNDRMNGDKGFEFSTWEDLSGGSSKDNDGMTFSELSCMLRNSGTSLLGLYFNIGENNGKEVYGYPLYGGINNIWAIRDGSIISLKLKAVGSWSSVSYNYKSYKCKFNSDGSLESITETSSSKTVSFTKNRAEVPGLMYVYKNTDGTQAFIGVENTPASIADGEKLVKLFNNVTRFGQSDSPFIIKTNSGNVTITEANDPT